MSEPVRWRTAADTARRLGLTVRALRLYEARGLVRPGRNAAGWRVYGPEEMARLHQVVALKRLGLPLARIAELTEGGAPDLDRVLALQEQDLVDRKTRVDRALDLVRRARARLAAGEALPTDDLVTLIKETVVTDRKPSPELEALFDKHYTPEQRETLARRKVEAYDHDQDKFSQTWAGLIAEAERLKDGDPGAPEALDLARRWGAEVARFTGGDPGMRASVRGLYEDAYSNPQTAAAMPFSESVWRFMGEAARRLQAAEGAG
jgi:DNA-binding transcriptional MerR regulator